MCTSERQRDEFTAHVHFCSGEERHRVECQKVFLGRKAMRHEQLLPVADVSFT
jgi:hypothetical protein